MMKDALRIGVIAEVTTIVGASIAQAAQMAAEEINADGGVEGRTVEIVSYDNHLSSEDSVHAFQHAVTVNKVNAVIASHISDVVLALMPWASALEIPLVTPGAASNEISLSVHREYGKNKYTFHGYLTSAALARSIADAARELLAGQGGMLTALILSEDAAWTVPLDAGFEELLPKIGLNVIDRIRFPVDTTDYAPLFERIKRAKPDVIITGMTKVGVQPVAQWKRQQIHIPMFGMNSQASNGDFGTDTNDAADGVVYQAIAGPGIAVTSKTAPFAEGFKKKFGNYPSYAGYTAYDEVYYIADAVRRAGSTDSKKLVDALETTDWEGTIGRVQFYGKDDQFTHSIRYGKGLIAGVTLQWQDGRQVCVWPREVAQARPKFPSNIAAVDR